MNDGILFASNGEIAAQAITAILTQRGFCVVRSFDLRSALAAHADYDCPCHGTAHCTCQFVVLLVYGDTAEPVVVTTHSHDAHARLRIIQDGLGRPDLNLVEQVMAALVEAALARPVTAARLTEEAVDAE